MGNINKAGTPYSFQPTYSTATNHMTQIGGSTPSYDANGNVTNDFLHTYSWDSNGRPVTIDTVGIIYDALGRMVEQNRSGAYTQIVYAPSGAKLALMNGSTLQKGFVPLAGGAMAVYNSGGLAYYRHSDWLGSSRLASTPTRTIYSDGAYAPFGEPYAQSGANDLSFTGMSQDTVSNLYDFPAREYGIQGRWPSPDPAGASSMHLGDPQTLNRYAYVRNSPLMLTDPTGLDGMDYYDCLSTRNDCNVGWEGDFGWGTSYTLNGMNIPASLGADLLSNPDAATSCVSCESPGIGIDQNGLFQLTLKDWIFIHCVWFSDGDVCVMAPKGRQYLQVINPDDVYFSSDGARVGYTVGLAGTLADAQFKSALINMAIGDALGGLSAAAVEGVPAAASAIDSAQTGLNAAFWEFAANNPGVVLGMSGVVEGMQAYEEARFPERGNLMQFVGWVLDSYLQP